MKLLSDQRKLYLLAAVLLALTVVLCLTWRIWQVPGGDDGGTATGAPSASPGASTQTLIPLTTPEATEASASAAKVSTIVYYQDNYGYLVPVMKRVPDQPGIAKATLSLMVSSPQNDMEAARLGLRTVLPENTTIDLDISDGEACIDLGKEVTRLSDAAAESNMVNAVVQTLTEFPTVETVRFLIGGMEVSTLPHGTSVSGKFTRGMLNLESASSELPPEDAQTVMLYFPGETASLIVPVTRMVYGEADVNTAVLELVKGPSAASPLENALPAGCGLIDVQVKDAEVTINFTKEFIGLAETTDGGRQALKALTLTCAQFPGVESVAIQVEGEPYHAGESALTIPTFVNDAEAIVDQVLQTQSTLLFELE